MIHLIITLALTFQSQLGQITSPSVARVPDDVNNCLQVLAKAYQDVDNFNPSTRCASSDQHLLMASNITNMLDKMEEASLNNLNSATSKIDTDKCSEAFFLDLCQAYNCDLIFYADCGGNCTTQVDQSNENILHAQNEILQAIDSGLMNSYEINEIIGATHIMEADINKFLSSSQSGKQFSELTDYSHEVLLNIRTATPTLIDDINSFLGFDYIKPETFIAKFDYELFLKAFDLDDFATRNVSGMSGQDTLNEQLSIIQSLSTKLKAGFEDQIDYDRALSFLKDDLKVDYMFSDLYNRLGTDIRSIDLGVEDFDAIVSNLRQSVDSYFAKINVILPDFVAIRKLFESKIEEQSSEIQQASESSVDATTVKNFMNSTISAIQNQEIITEHEKELALLNTPSYLKRVVESVKLLQTSLSPEDILPKVYSNEDLRSYGDREASTVTLYKMYFNSEAEFMSQPHYGAIKHGIDSLILNQNLKSLLKSEKLSGTILLLDVFNGKFMEDPMETISYDYNPDQQVVTKYAIEEFLQIFGLEKGSFDFTDVDLTDSSTKLETMIEKMKSAASNPLLSALNLDDSLFKILYPTFESETQENIDLLKTDITSINAALDQIIADLDDTEKEINANIGTEINSQHEEINLINDILSKLGLNPLNDTDKIDIDNQTYIIYLLTAFQYEIQHQLGPFFSDLTKIDLKNLVDSIKQLSEFSLDDPLADDSVYKLSNLIRFIKTGSNFVKGSKLLDNPLLPSFINDENEIVKSSIDKFAKIVDNSLDQNLGNSELDSATFDDLKTSLDTLTSTMINVTKSSNLNLLQIPQEKLHEIVQLASVTVDNSQPDNAAKVKKMIEDLNEAFPTIDLNIFLGIADRISIAVPRLLDDLLPKILPDGSSHSLESLNLTNQQILDAIIIMEEIVYNLNQKIRSDYFGIADLNSSSLSSIIQGINGFSTTDFDQALTNSGAQALIDLLTELKDYIATESIDTYENQVYSMIGHKVEATLTAILDYYEITERVNDFQVASTALLKSIKSELDILSNLINESLNVKLVSNHEILNGLFDDAVLSAIDSEVTVSIQEKLTNGDSTAISDLFSSINTIITEKLKDSSLANAESVNQFLEDLSTKTGINLTYDELADILIKNLPLSTAQEDDQSSTDSSPGSGDQSSTDSSTGSGDQSSTDSSTGSGDQSSTDSSPGSGDQSSTDSSTGSGDQSSTDSSTGSGDQSSTDFSTGSGDQSSTDSSTGSGDQSSTDSSTGSGDPSELINLDNTETTNSDDSELDFDDENGKREQLLRNKEDLENQEILTSISCNSCDIESDKSIPEIDLECRANKVVCNGKVPKCYLNYTYADGITKYKAGCAKDRESAQEEDISDEICSLKKNSRFCPIPNSSGHIVPALRTLKNLNCTYCCSAYENCNSFSLGKLAGIRSSDVSRLDKGFRVEDEKQEALTRMIAQSLSRQEKMNGLQRYVNNAAFAFMIMF